MSIDKAPGSGLPPISAAFDSVIGDVTGHEIAAAKDDKKQSAKAEFTKVSTANPLLHELLDRRIIRITGPIDDEIAASVISQMHMLEAMAPGKDIELRINSPGGSVTAGLAIFDTMKTINCDVKTVCEGECASMAAVLLAAGTPGKRFAMPHSTIMIHGPSGGIQGTEIDMHIYMKEIQRLKDVMIDILSSYMGLDEKQISAMMERDHFMSPKEAKAFGVIDEVVEHKHKPPAPRADSSNTGFTVSPVFTPFPPAGPSPNQPTLH